MSKSKEKCDGIAKKMAYTLNNNTYTEWISNNYTSESYIFQECYSYHFPKLDTGFKCCYSSADYISISIFLFIIVIIFTIKLY